MSSSEPARVLVLGATGMLGSTLVPVLESRGHRVVTHGRGGAADHHANLEIRDEAHRLLTAAAPRAIINLVGLTDVDRCEEHPNDAYRSNVLTVENVAGWINCSKSDCHLVHISTDQVYDGAGPHGEDAATLTNYYGFSKYAGEMAALVVPSTILRTNFFGRSRCIRRASLTDWLFSAIAKEAPVQLFDDVLFSPLSMLALSDMIELVVQRKPTGIFNLGAREGMSKADFAMAFAATLGLSTSAMTRVTTDQVTFLKTYRPKDMRMDCSKFESALGLRLPDLRTEIAHAAEEYHAVA